MLLLCIINTSVKSQQLLLQLRGHHGSLLNVFEINLIILANEHDACTVGWQADVMKNANLKKKIFFKNKNLVNILNFQNI